jgi:NAD(P)-dependent dehydrogenase (short-subunit alcohol dehydrogenase family)
VTRRLEGKVAIVTGAGSVGPGWGNGRATAVRFAEEGAKLFAVDRDAERLRETVERVVAVQYGARGIRVNTIVPGQLHTPMVEARLAKQRAGGDMEALLAQRQKRIPLGIEGDGRDTANAALFLASDEARFITGTEIVVDGGMTARCD